MTSQPDTQTLVEELMEKFEALGWMIAYTTDDQGVPTALLAGEHEVVEQMIKYLPAFNDLDMDRESLN